MRLAYSLNVTVSAIGSCVFLGLERFYGFFKGLRVRVRVRVRSNPKKTFKNALTLKNTHDPFADTVTFSENACGFRPLRASAAAARAASSLYITPLGRLHPVTCPIGESHTSSLKL